jgi:hypothetical protein
MTSEVLPTAESPIIKMRMTDAFVPLFGGIRSSHYTQRPPTIVVPNTNGTEANEQQTKISPNEPRMSSRKQSAPAPWNGMRRAGRRQAPAGVPHTASAGRGSHHRYSSASYLVLPGPGQQIVGVRSVSHIIVIAKRAVSLHMKRRRASVIFTSIMFFDGNLMFYGADQELSLAQAPSSSRWQHLVSLFSQGCWLAMRSHSRRQLAIRDT